VACMGWATIRAACSMGIWSSHWAVAAPRTKGGQKMNPEIWDEFVALHDEAKKLRARMGILEVETGRLKEVVKEQGCPNWGKKAEGLFGPCDTCAYCRLFYGPPSSELCASS
jgi:hypothetical protein